MEPDRYLSGQDSGSHSAGMGLSAPAPPTTASPLGRTETLDSSLDLSPASPTTTLHASHAAGESPPPGSGGAQPPCNHREPTLVRMSDASSSAGAVDRPASDTPTPLADVRNLLPEFEQQSSSLPELTHITGSSAPSPSGMPNATRPGALQNRTRGPVVVTASVEAQSFSAVNLQEMEEYPALAPAPSKSHGANFMWPPSLLRKPQGGEPIFSQGESPISRKAFSVNSTPTTSPKQLHNRASDLEMVVKGEQASRVAGAPGVEPSRSGAVLSPGSVEAGSSRLPIRAQYLARDPSPGKSPAYRTSTGHSSLSSPSRARLSSPSTRTRSSRSPAG